MGKHVGISIEGRTSDRTEVKRGSKREIKRGKIREVGKRGKGASVKG